MLSSTIDEIRKSNARFARDVEYLKETASDDEIDIRTEAAESMFDIESIGELEEALEMVNSLNISSEEDTIIESKEIQKILESDKDLTFEEMAIED